MAASYRFVVTGRVQGVGFRYSTVEKADRLGLTGWVRNRDDGTVEGIAQGDESALEQLRTWLGHGPSAAEVDELEWTPVVVEALTGFATRR